MSTYTGTINKDLVVTTPTEGATPPKELNDAIREIKTVLKNLNGVTTVTDTYTALITDEVILCNKATPFTITLPAAANCGTSAFTKRYVFINIGAGAVTIDGSGSETIDGAATLSLASQYTSTTMFTNGSNWFTASYLLADGAITAAKLASSAVETAKINNAAVTADKLAAAVAGSGLAGGAGTALSVNVDGSTLEITTDTLNVKALGIAAAQLAADAVETAKIKDANVTTGKIADGAVTGVKQGRLITQALTLTGTATTADDIITMDAGTGKNVNLYAASGNTGRILTVCRLGNGTVTIDGNASETIEYKEAASTTMVLATTVTTINNVAYTEDCRSVTLQCTGTGWLCIGRETYFTVESV